MIGTPIEANAVRHPTGRAAISPSNPIGEKVNAGSVCSRGATSRRNISAFEERDFARRRLLIDVPLGRSSLPSFQR